MAEIRPVRKRRVPKYPTMAQVEHNPVLLRHLPERWNVRPVLCAALTFTLTSGLFSCSGSGSERGAAGAPMPLGGDGAHQSPNTKVSAESVGVSVPLFAYGDGFGAFGCVSVTAPMFLSEDEAAAIITGEAAKLGVEFVVGDHIIDGAIIPETSRGHHDDLENAAGSLTADGHSQTLELSYEFVSREDYHEWEPRGKGQTSTVSSYNIKDAAERLAENNTDLAVFYDPVGTVENFSAEYDEWLAGYVKAKGLDPDGDYYGKLTSDDHLEIERKWSELYDKYEAIARERTEEDLRMQVRDFVAWLTAQGVI